MGGTSFGQSQSLITVQHRAFEEWCASQLSGVSLEVRSFRYLLDKEVHGDLDLICAYDGIEMPRSAKGNNAGRLDADGSEIDPPNKLTREQQSVRDVYVEIARALKAYAWHRSTFDVPVLSLAVRCREVPPIARLVNLENGIDPSVSCPLSTSSTMTRPMCDGADYKVTVVLPNRSESCPTCSHSVLHFRHISLPPEDHEKHPPSDITVHRVAARAAALGTQTIRQRISPPSNSD